MLKLTFVAVALVRWSLAYPFVDSSWSQVPFEPFWPTTTKATNSLTLNGVARNKGPTRLTPEQLAELTPYAQFARAAYCPANVLGDWNCGEACRAIPDFQPALVGGDGDAIQRFFVGFWRSKNTVVIAHQGTDPMKLMAILTDINLSLHNLDPLVYPGVPSGTRVHQGFLDEHSKTIPAIAAAVNDLLLTTGATNVTFVGHSLGGALAELDSFYFSLHLPSTIGISATVFGKPRVGNPAYAEFFDTKVPNFKRVNNKRDPAPIVPGITWGYSHPHGEIHILDSDVAYSCPGDDDTTDPECEVLTVPNIFVSHILDHFGPYQGIFMGTTYC